MKDLKKIFPETTGKSTAPSAKARNVGVQKYRRENRRIDYYPADSARDAIDRLHQRYPAHSVRAVIDALIKEGDKVFSGKIDMKTA